LIDEIKNNLKENFENIQKESPSLAAMASVGKDEKRDHILKVKQSWEG
jgi:hypothetical protein